VKRQTAKKMGRIIVAFRNRRSAIHGHHGHLCDVIDQWWLTSVDLKPQYLSGQKGASLSGACRFVI
jgi:hypothetical protein